MEMQFVKGKESKLVLKQNWLFQNEKEENKGQNGIESWKERDIFTLCGQVV